MSLTFYLQISLHANTMTKKALNFQFQIYTGTLYCYTHMHFTDGLRLVCASVQMLHVKCVRLRLSVCMCVCASEYSD